MTDNETNQEAPPNSAGVPSFSDPFEVSFQRHQHEIADLEPEHILSVNLDLPRAIATGLGVSKEVEPFREQLAQLPGFDIRNYDDLASYAQALSFANTLHLLASEPVGDIKPLYERALALRETLNLDVRALVHRGLLDGQQLENLSGNVGYKNVATDLQILGVLLRTNWSEIENKSAMTRDEIDDAVMLAHRVLVAIGEREQADANVNYAADTRSRAFTLFVRAYDELRRAMSFLRWRQEDVDDFVPTLWTGRGRKKAGTEITSERETNGSANGNVSPTNAAAPPTNGAAPSAASAQGPFAE